MPTPNAAVSRIRSDLDHPIIDSDGHAIEYLPAVAEILDGQAGPKAVEGLRRIALSARQMWNVPPEQMRAAAMMRHPWWGLPAANTLDRATAMLPGLMYDRLDEVGIDYAVVYPTYGLTVMGGEDDELRVQMARAFNTYYAEEFGPFADRLTPVGIIPMNTPEEAIRELDHCVSVLGLKAFMFGGLVYRRYAGFEDPTTSPRGARWVDTIGMDSLHDYDPLWSRCVELGVAPTFHSSGMGWGSRTSPTNYVYNHLGSFAVAGEALCRAITMGGVAHRFPTLRFAFLEGGVMWAVNLASDLIGHYEKRNAGAIGHYDPKALDRSELATLFARHGSARAKRLTGELDDPIALSMLSQADEPDAMLDEFDRSGLRSVDDIIETFGRYHFGCEADDPMTAVAFDRRRNPGGAVFNAVFASDVGHWDVPDVRDVLPEAFELVEEGHIDADDFRAFTFDHPMSLWASTNPTFFQGTVIESASDRWLHAVR